LVFFGLPPRFPFAREASAFADDLDAPNSFAISRRLAAKMQLQDGHFIG
jgi:hypothetical protein